MQTAVKHFFVRQDVIRIERISPALTVENMLHVVFFLTEVPGKSQVYINMYLILHYIMCINNLHMDLYSGLYCILEVDPDRTVFGMGVHW